MVGINRYRATAGFTLVEMLVVLTIVALVAGISSLSLQRLRDKKPPLEVSRALYAGMTAARYRAMNTGENAVVEVDVAGKSFSFPYADNKIALPPSWTLTATVGRVRLASRDVSKIVFLPDGTSSGADIEFGPSEGQTAIVRVNWLTGITEYMASDK